MSDRAILAIAVLLTSAIYNYKRHWSIGQAFQEKISDSWELLKKELG